LQRLAVFRQHPQALANHCPLALRRFLTLFCVGLGLEGITCFSATRPDVVIRYLRDGCMLLSLYPTLSDHYENGRGNCRMEFRREQPLTFDQGLQDAALAVGRNMIGRPCHQPANSSE
jgi:hypothetical protein